MNTSASLLIPVLHGFNGRGDNFPRKEAIVLSEPLAAKCTFVTPPPKKRKKRQVCNLDKIKPLRARVVTVLMLPTMEQDERDK